MNYEETFVAGKRDREVRPRKLALDDDESKEDELMALYGRKNSGEDAKSAFAKPAALPPQARPAKPADSGTASEASTFR